MKNIFIISLVIFGLKGAYTQTNIYRQFPDSNAIWNVTYGGYQAPSCSKYSYTLFGDTIVNSKTYKKIRKQYSNYPYSTSGYCDWCCPSPTNIVYSGALREDTIARKIYYLPVGNNTDTLLYDFTLTVGNSIPLGWNNWCSSMYVGSVDSVLIGTNYRKRWNMHISNNDCLSAYASSVIEGIGNTFGLLERLDFFESGGNLDCFSQNNKTLYPMYSETSGCGLVTSIDELSAVGFSVSPNPLSSQTTLTFDNQLQNATLTLYNCFGQKVKEIININEQTIILTRDNLKNGLYFVHLTQGNYEVAVQKLVFID